VPEDSEDTKQNHVCPLIYKRDIEMWEIFAGYEAKEENEQSP
jgi:hypothetical protein